MCQWRINTQVHQTLKDTPYHFTNGQHPRVGISNHPMNEDILATLVTEGELQDVYTQMWASTDGANESESRVLTKVMAVNSFCNVMVSVAETADTLVPPSPLGKHKGISPKEFSIVTWDVHAAK
jgi:hypothetical protein